MNKSKWAAVPAMLLSAMLAINPVRASAQTAPENALTTIPAEEELTWPRVIKNAAETLTVYQPQIEQWNGIQIATRAAVSVQPSDGSQPIYGVVWMKARADVDKAARVVTFRDFEITKVSFPTAPEKESQYGDLLRKLLPTGVKTVALDHLEASLAVSAAVKKQQELNVSNDVPRILYATTPTVLVLVDGPPVLRPMTGLPAVQRVLNTYALIVKIQNRFYLTALNFWYEAKDIGGPWTPVTDPPAILDQVKEAAAEAKVTDLMEPDPNAPGSRRRRDPRQHGAHRADPDRWAGEDAADRGDRQPASDPEQRRRDFHEPAGEQVLRAALGALVQVEVALRPVGIRAGQVAAGGLREDSARQRARERAGLRAGHAAGEGGADRQLDPADGGGQSLRGETGRDVRRPAAVRADPGNRDAICRQFPAAGHRARPQLLLLRAERRLVHRRLSDRTLDAGHLGAAAKSTPSPSRRRCTTSPTSTFTIRLRPWFTPATRPATSARASRRTTRWSTAPVTPTRRGATTSGWAIRGLRLQRGVLLRRVLRVRLRFRRLALVPRLLPASVVGAVRLGAASS